MPGDNTSGCSAPPMKELPIQGEVFSIQGHPAFLIQPPGGSSAVPIPWVWYAPTLPGLPNEAETWMFERFLAAGIAIAGIDVGESYGSPAGRELYSALYREMTTRRALSQKPCLLGRSRGGLMVYGWACEHANSVACIAGIYPVCNLLSYPSLDKACGAYELTVDELNEQLSRHNPIDRLGPLAAADVPIFHIHGDVDEVVPLELNSGEVALRYQKQGGKMELLVPAGQGHNMWPGFFKCEELMAFILAHARD